VLAGDPEYDGRLGRQLDPDDIFGSPDGIWVDPTAALDPDRHLQQHPEPGRPRGTTASATTRCSSPTPRPARSSGSSPAPRGCEVTGVITTPDQRTMFVNIQHPGESTTYWNAQTGAPSAANPRTVSNWPEFSPTGRPRPATVVIRKIGGGKIGT
jgi:uncharacterized protein